MLLKILLFTTTAIRLKHLKNYNFTSLSNNLNIHDDNDYKTPLENEIERAKELDHRFKRILSRPITDESLHNPNIPIFRPYDLTEEQQDVLLSHD